MISSTENIPTPTVSVCVITYNHEKYIRQCLQSIVDQETDFDFELIVADDCSTDNTPELVKEFINKYPAIVRGIFQETNTGGTKNYLDVHSAARGKYVAHMDGDDYALPTKLQKQVDVFRNNPELSMVVHGTKIFDEAAGKYLQPVKRFYDNRKENLDFLLLNLPYFAHSTKMYKKCSDEDFNFKGNDIIDCWFHIFHASKGDIYMIPEELIVYRKNIGLSTIRNSEGIVASQQTNRHIHQAIDNARLFNVDKDVILRSHAQAELSNAASLLRSKSYLDYQRAISLSVSYKRIGAPQYILYILRGLPVFSRLLWVSMRWVVYTIGAFRLLSKTRWFKWKN
jgi:glycosyltransferase involved in cell wall biosynthesis